MKKGVLRNFAKFTGKHLCPGLFFNKAAGLRPQVRPLVSGPQLYLKRDSSTGAFCDFAKFLRTPFLQNSSGRLLLRLISISKFRKLSNI